MGVEEHIVPGKILYLSLCFPHEINPKNRYFVVVGTGTSPLLLKINTSKELSEIAKRKGESLFKLKNSVYAFLQYDSYLDCGTVWSTLITTNEVIKQLTDDPRRVISEVTDDHKNEIIRRTDRSNSVAAIHKRAIAEALRRK